MLDIGNATSTADENAMQPVYANMTRGHENVR